MLVNITPINYNICWEFSNKVVSTNINCYKSRNQNNTTKIIDDILCGKLAEVACYDFLISRGMEVTPVDFEIYSKKSKSFSADLTARYPNGSDWYFHVKSMKESMSKSFGLSWSFQVQDKLIKEPGVREYLMLCETVKVSPEDSIIDIKCVVLANSIINKLGEPRLFKLQGIKKVLYWENIKDDNAIKKL